MNSPIPAGMAIRNESGMASTIFFLRTSQVSSKNKTPDKNTTPRAVCQVIPSPMTSEYAKKAFRPMPGASARGTFAQNAKRKVPKAAEIAVAVITAPKSRPVSDRIIELTKRMQDMVRKIVKPAEISLPDAWGSGLNPNNLVSMGERFRHHYTIKKKALKHCVSKPFLFNLWLFAERI